MNEQPFKANDWLEPIFSQKLSENIDESINLENKKSSPISLLVPGWTGDGIVSKTALSIRAASENLWKNSLKLFSSFKDSNNNLKNLILMEFNLHIRSKEGLDLEFNSIADFWPVLFPRDPSSQRKEIKDFINIYCYRAVITYLYRIQFIASLSRSLCLKPTENNLLNPSGFLSKIFQQGGPKELPCESLHANSYSWFRPDPEHKEIVVKLSRELENISTIEFLKIFSNLPGMENLPEFSHTLSHKTFGEFLNQLLIKFPDWILGNKSQYQSGPLNTKFGGDYLCSLTNSFWLGQNGIDLSNPKIVIPDFIGEGSEDGNFLKICQELQFLTFLSNLSIKLGKESTSFICNTIKQKYSKPLDGGFGQMNLFLNKGHKSEVCYDRMVLNFCNLPKKNPHHHLINLINSQIPILNQNGFLFIFSNQNLFVSSHTERVQEILRSFKLEAYFNFEKLKGKGEITSFLYVLRKRGNKESILENFSEKKETFFSFLWSGNLSSFYNFHLLNKELDFFLKNKNPFSFSIYHKDISPDLNFEFLQDAILDGVLLHSSSNDTSKVTHPNFFRNITKCCITFDNFFKIESIDPMGEQGKSNNDLTLELLGKKIRQEDKFPFILIVNLTDVNNIKIEIIPSSSFTAKVNENGYACFQYFGLIPKKFNLSINLFREYFQTDLGLQIIQLSLNSSTKLKSKIKSLLVPGFFLPENNSIPELKKEFQFLDYEKSELINSHPDTLLKQFENLKNSLDDLVLTSPLKILESLTNFKLNVELAISWIYSNNSSAQNFKYTNPIIKDSISKLKLHPIYPVNKDIHIEVYATSKEELNLPFTHSSLKQKDSIHFLEINSSKGPLLGIYSDQEILLFIQFLLNSVTGISTLKIIYSLSVPKIGDLKSVLSDFDQINNTFNLFLTDSKKIITNILMQKISSLNNGILH